MGNFRRFFSRICALSRWQCTLVITDFNMLIAVHPPPSQCGVPLPSYFWASKVVSTTIESCYFTAYFFAFFCWAVAVHTVSPSNTLRALRYGEMLWHCKCPLVLCIERWWGDDGSFLLFVIVSLCEIVPFPFGFAAAMMVTAAAMMGIMAWLLCDRRFGMEMPIEEWADDEVGDRNF